METEKQEEYKRFQITLKERIDFNRLRQRNQCLLENMEYDKQTLNKRLIDFKYFDDNKDRPHTEISHRHYLKETEKYHFEKIQEYKNRKMLSINFDYEINNNLKNFIVELEGDTRRGIENNEYRRFLRITENFSV